jgi:head-tail adaptor
MSIGERKHRMMFWRAVDTLEDDTGEPIRTWDLVGTCWVKVRRIRQREGEISGGVMAEQVDEIEAAYSPQLAALTAKDRGTLRNGTYYNFAGPPNHVNLDKRLLLFVASAGLNAG